MKAKSYMKKNTIHDRINKKWLRFAEEDYNLVNYLWNTENRFYRSICFHAQQLERFYGNDLSDQYKRDFLAQLK